MPDWKQLGSHRYYVEDEVLFIEAHGPFTLEDTKFITWQSPELAKQWGYYLLVADARDGMNLTPEARRYSNASAKNDPIPGAILIMGASLAVRTMTALLTNAARLFGKKQQATIDHCANLDEVPQWLAAQRRIHRKHGSAGAPDVRGISDGDGRKIPVSRRE